MYVILHTLHVILHTCHMCYITYMLHVLYYIHVTCVVLHTCHVLSDMQPHNCPGFKNTCCCLNKKRNLYIRKGREPVIHLVNTYNNKTH